MRPSAERLVPTRVEDVVDQVRQDPWSCGVSLSTEDPVNVTFSEHFGFRQAGYARVAPDLETSAKGW
jgi:hypothetical protein